ncbi:catabolite repression protein creC [Radiomyces spectabilis]|uniref:catabolite repression protein creC n=1 Tax=Radiomyces spectabilis TaxID=64574 RepID=UPI00221F2558|nr:catabolite repression protein creC [Radiomyces spectabilis]KAI8379722.1 catabolite repression protein creC [Radiomyces spectabilis]
MHEQLSKKLQARSANDPFLFYNVGMSFVWMDGYQRSKEPLSRIVFTKGCPTCHDVNMLTRCNDHLDVIIGFSSGDCVWYDPLSGRYIRLNKGGVLNSSSVTNVKWIPGSEDLFMASFSDGTIMILDKEKEDQTFSVPSVSSWTSDQFQASKPHRNTKYNPVSHWRVNTKGVSAFEFSPNGEHVAVVGMDGQLRIINYQKERLEDVFGSYYGQLLCVAWSPDGRYLLTGGQDDLVTIWAFPEQRIVARCQGHKSWVTGVAFDPWRCDDRVYRFCSVGDDCKLIFWDFSFNALHRPKQASGF